MSLPDILLSLLREPMSGSDLIRLFRGTINHFWKTDLSQIYRGLEALEKDGCLCSESLPSPRGPARRVYRLTDRGRERLAGWIRQPATIPAAKFEYLAQIFSVTADEQPAERALEILESMHGEAVAAVATLEGIDRQFRELADGKSNDMPSSLFYPWLTLRHGLLRRRAFLEWLEECRTLLQGRSPHWDAETGRQAMTDLMEALRIAADHAGALDPTEENEKTCISD